ncbi:type 1 glutamine amidotransferase [Brachybacterium hainanense]|uniref:Type 1 glutamine amidotransferase n=1 Tax=Brachybacterium hainanense TaxID=1541174 RepID=A0ABV6RAW3_9MICO
MNPHASDCLVIDLSPASGPGALAPVLSRAGLLVHLVQPARGDQIPSDLLRMEGLVVLGDAAAPRQEEHDAAMLEVRALLRRALSRHLPTLGIGLGAVLAAHALEGRVAGSAHPDAPARCEALLLTPSGRSDALLAALAPPDGDDVPVLRRPAGSSVIALPPGARTLAHDAQGGIAAFRVEESLWGLLFHPEADPGPLGADPRDGAAWTALLEAFALRALGD